MLKHFFKYFIGFVFLAVACDSGEPKPVDIGLAYYPLQVGNYYVYDVDETIYSEVAPTEHNLYQLKVEVTDSFPSAGGNYTYVLSRSTREDESVPWSDLDTWSVRGDDREVIVNEGNVSFVKLEFPVAARNAWNGNKYNNQDEDEYEITAIDNVFAIEGTNFEKTLKVVQEDNEDFIVFLDKREEVYARDIGLIYKEATLLNYCTSNDCIGQQKIKSGFIYKQQLSEYDVR